MDSSLFLDEYGHFINGAWVPSQGGGTISVSNPATGRELARIQAGTVRDVDAAVAAAKNAFPKWSRSPAEKRQAICSKFLVG